MKHQLTWKRPEKPVTKKKLTKQTKDRRQWEKNWRRTKKNKKSKFVNLSAPNRLLPQHLKKYGNFTSVYLLIAFARGKTRKIIIPLAKLIAFLLGFNIKTFSLQNKWSYLTISLRIHPILCSPVKVHRLIHVNGALFARFETIEVFNSKKMSAVKQ